jgi:hypothetical protein
MGGRGRHAKVALTMASMRQLPSGNWQAAVLLDNGRRITQAMPTHAEALRWAIETEAKRDEQREARRLRAHDEDVAVLIAGLERYAQQGLLRNQHLEQLRALIDTARGAEPLPSAAARPGQA